MGRNFLKINKTDYFMESEPIKTDEEMIDNGYIKVSDIQFTYKDVLKELES